jgi:hypothetical protein
MTTKKQAAVEPIVKLRPSQGAAAQVDLKKVRALARELGLGPVSTPEQRKGMLPFQGVTDDEIEAVAAAFDSFGKRIGVTIDTDAARTMIAHGKAYRPVMRALEMAAQQGRDMLGRKRAPVAKLVSLAYATMDGLMKNPDNADMADAWQSMLEARAKRTAKAKAARLAKKAGKQGKPASPVTTPPPADTVSETVTTVTETKKATGS